MIGRFVVIGLGGVGSHLIEPLSTFLNTLGSTREHRQELLLVDGDFFEMGNGYRMNLFSLSNKAKAWEARLKESLTWTNVMAIPEYITPSNAEIILRDGDVVFLCCDNHATRKLVSDRVGQLKDCILLSGGNDGIDASTDGTCGNIQVYCRENGETVHGVPLDKFHPEIAKPADKNPDALDCFEAAAQGDPQLGFANLAVASALCNGLLRLLMLPDGERMYDEVVFDIKAGVSVPQYISGPPRSTDARTAKEPARKAAAKGRKMVVSTAR